MQVSQLNEFVNFVTEFFQDRYFRQIEPGQISAFQKVLHDYDFQSVKKAFERHASDEKKQDFLPNPQNILSQLKKMDVDSKKERVAQCCDHKLFSGKCGKEAVINMGWRKDEPNHFLCEMHLEEVRQKTIIDHARRNDVKNFEKEARKAGMANKEYFYATGYGSFLERMRGAEAKKTNQRVDEVKNRPATIFEFEAERLKENASKTNGNNERKQGNAKRSTVREYLYGGSRNNR